jgi:hypothetical protein
MDPITIGAAVVAAIGAEVKDKASGAAAKWLVEAAKERATRLVGVTGESNAEKLARRAIEEVIAEAAQYPPEKALLVRPLGTPVGAVGVWGPHGTLRLNLLWVNRADFPIHVRDLHVTAKVAGPEPEWQKEFAEEFTLTSRGDVERMLELVPHAVLPSFERGGANCDVSVSAVVSGPWEDGRAQRAHDLVPLVGIWLPTVGLDASGPLDDPADIDARLESLLRQVSVGGRREIIYADVDRQLRLRVGATRGRLEIVAQQLGCELNARGPNVALLHRPRVNPPTNFMRRRNRTDGM